MSMEEESSYFAPLEKYFYQVLALHQQEMEWKELSQLIPSFPRGWYELSRLSVEDRIEFTRGYWMAKFSTLKTRDFHFEYRLEDFFNRIEDIGIFATQMQKNDFFALHMFYTLNDGSYFHGSPPASENAIKRLNKQFEVISLPEDYLLFLQIHDGFNKCIDRGLISTRDLVRVYQQLQHVLSQTLLVRPDGGIVDPVYLVPFYESSRLHSYQCFHFEGYSGKLVENIFLSINDPLEPQSESYLKEDLAFTNFLEWLLFYCEDFEQ